MVIAVIRRVIFYVLQCLRLHYKEEKDDHDYNSNDATVLISIISFIPDIISFITAASKWM